MKYTAYFDSGTTNSRLYLLDEAGQSIYRSRCAVGAKDSAKARNGEVQTKALHNLYVEALEKCALTEADVAFICISGNVTAQYGVHEVEHLYLPQSAEEFKKNLFTFTESKYFRREITLVPGVKQITDDFDMTGLIRGEEIELFGMLDQLNAKYGDQTIAVAIPGSHTNIAYLRGDAIIGAFSNITGEIFHALKEETVLAPILDNSDGSLDTEWVLKGMKALNDYGIARALNLTHAMRILERNTPLQRRSYAEGVIFGDIAQSAQISTEKMFPECRTLVISADGEVGELYKTLFSTCDVFDTVELLPSAEEPWSLIGFKKLFGYGK